MLSELFNNKLINLSNQKRFSNLGFITEINVAEHSLNTATIGIIIGRYINEVFPGSVDLKDLAYRAVIHDYGEAVTCDITYDVKYSNSDLPYILQELETKNLKNIGLDDKFIYDINHAKSDTLEGFIVELADRLDALFSLFKEYMVRSTKYYKDSIIHNSIPSVFKAMRSIQEYDKIDFSKLTKLNKLLEDLTYKSRELSEIKELI